MGKKAQQPSKAAAKGTRHAAAAAAAAADSKKQKGQAGSKKSKRDVGYDSLRDPLDRELALVGLRVKQITADGNCFFRALSDQLEGNEGQHSALRARVVAFMKEQEDDFAPFVEDDQTFEAYTARMKKEGTWAGHMELQAASLLLKVNILLYQAGQPRWAITNFPQGTRKLHLSYHAGEHYNSVRRADDYTQGPPEPIDELAPVSTAAQLQCSWSAADEAAVAAGTGCDNRLLIKQQLEAAKGDADTAIEAIIEILAAEDSASIPLPAAALTGSQAELGIAAGQSVDFDQQEHDGASALQQLDAALSPGDQPAVAAIELLGVPSTGSTALCDSSTAQAAAGAAGSGSTTDQQHIQQEPDDTNDASSTSSTKPSVVSKSSEKPAKGVKLKGASKLKQSGKGPADAGDDAKKPSRNKPCPCGSGRKHKNCCGMKGGTGTSSNSKAAAAADGLPVMLDTLHI